MVHEQFWHRAIWQRAYPVESKGTNFSDTVPQRTSKRRACSCSATAEALSCYSTDSDGAVSTEDSPKKRTKPFTATFAQSKYFNSIVHVKSVEHRWTIIRPLHQFTANALSDNGNYPSRAKVPSSSYSWLCKQCDERVILWIIYAIFSVLATMC